MIQVPNGDPGYHAAWTGKDRLGPKGAGAISEKEMKGTITSTARPHEVNLAITIEVPDDSRLTRPLTKPYAAQRLLKCSVAISETNLKTAAYPRVAQHSQIRNVIAIQIRNEQQAPSSGRLGGSQKCTIPSTQKDVNLETAADHQVQLPIAIHVDNSQTVQVATGSSQIDFGVEAARSVAGQQCHIARAVKYEQIQPAVAIEVT